MGGIKGCEGEAEREKDEMNVSTGERFREQRTRKQNFTTKFSFKAKSVGSSTVMRLKYIIFTFLLPTFSNIYTFRDKKKKTLLFLCSVHKATLNLHKQLMETELLNRSCKEQREGWTERNGERRMDREMIR